MLKASDIMTKDVLTITPDASVLDAVSMLMEHDITGLPVVDREGCLRGIISEKDILVLLFEDDENKKCVSDFMSKKVVTFKVSDNIHEICEFLIKSSVRRVPVLCADGKLAGIISRRDIIPQIMKMKGI